MVTSNIRIASRVLAQSLPSRTLKTQPIYVRRPKTPFKSSSQRNPSRTFATTQLARTQPGKKGTSDKAENPGSTLLATFQSASRTTKVIVIIGLCIAGGAETVFWIRVLWRKFVSNNEHDKDGST